MIKITTEIEDIESVQVFYVSVKEYDENWESLVKELKQRVYFYYVRLPLGEYDRLYLYNEYWWRARTDPSTPASSPRPASAGVSSSPDTPSAYPGNAGLQGPDAG